MRYQQPVPRQQRKEIGPRRPACLHHRWAPLPRSSTWHRQPAWTGLALHWPHRQRHLTKMSRKSYGGSSGFISESSPIRREISTLKIQNAELRQKISSLPPGDDDEEEEEDPDGEQAADEEVASMLLGPCLTP